jgi:hypothetical protein
MPKNLLATALTLAVGLVAATDPTASVAKDPRPAGEHVGGWTVTFANGVVETCVICPDGTAAATETLRTSAGKIDVREGRAVFVFEDGRLERWTEVGDRQVVEHFATADQFPNGTPVLGVAERVK